MRRGDRGERFVAAGFCVAAIIGCLILIYAIAWLNGSQAERRRVEPRAHFQDAKNQAEQTCAGRDAAAAFECIYEKMEVSEDTARAEQDLTAQQRAAWAAMLSAGLAIFALIVTAVGVWFVKRTLDATLRAVEDTSKATKAMERQTDLLAQAQRPWLSIAAKVSHIGKFVNGKNVVVALNVTINNHSEFPAHDVRVAGRGHFWIGGNEGQASVEKDHKFLDYYINEGAALNGQAVFPRAPADYLVIAVIDDPDKCFELGRVPPLGTLTVACHYVFSGGEGKTYQSFIISMPTEGPPKPNSEPTSKESVDPAQALITAPGGAIAI